MWTVETSGVSKPRREGGIVNERSQKLAGFRL